MGMFDHVQCDVPLPDGFKSRGFQTKDFDGLLESYRITSDGRLMRRNEWADEGEPWQQVSFHGVLNFYGSGCFGDWHEYDAKFTDGLLVEIAVHEPPAQVQRPGPEEE